MLSTKEIYHIIKTPLYALKSTIALLMLLVLFMTGACNHIDLVDEVSSNRVPVRMIFDWSDDPGANPKGMTLYIYRIGLTRATSPYIYDIKGCDGARIMLPPGTYAAICHNSDSDRHGFVGQDDYDTFGLMLNSVRSSGGMGAASYSLKVKDNERLAHAPDSIWVGKVEAFAVLSRDALLAQENHGGRGEETGPIRLPETVVTIPMQSVVQHYKFIIHHPINFSTAKSVDASVTGMPSTVHPGRGMTGDETVTHSFGMHREKDGSLQGELLTFGHCSSKPLGTRADDVDELLHLLKIQATHGNGQLTSSSHDVTNQIHEWESQDPGGGPLEIIVELDTVVIPPPKPGSSGGQGGGFSPTVGGWTGTQESLGM